MHKMVRFVTILLNTNPCVAISNEKLRLNHVHIKFRSILCIITMMATDSEKIIIIESYKIVIFF